VTFTNLHPQITHQIKQIPKAGQEQQSEAETKGS